MTTVTLTKDLQAALAQFNLAADEIRLAIKSNQRPALHATQAKVRELKKSFPQLLSPNHPNFQRMSSTYFQHAPIRIYNELAGQVTISPIILPASAPVAPPPLELAPQAQNGGWWVWARLSEVTTAAIELGTAAYAGASSAASDWWTSAPSVQTRSSSLLYEEKKE